MRGEPDNYTRASVALSREEVLKRNHEQRYPLR